MTAATLWRHQAYQNVFLIGAGSTIAAGGPLFDSLTARGVPLVVEWNDATLEVCLHQTGQTQDDLVPV